MLDLVMMQIDLMHHTQDIPHRACRSMHGGHPYK